MIKSRFCFGWHVLRVYVVYGGLSFGGRCPLGDGAAVVCVDVRRSVGRPRGQTERGEKGKTHIEEREKRRRSKVRTTGSRIMTSVYGMKRGRTCHLHNSTFHWDLPPNRCDACRHARDVCMRSSCFGSEAIQIQIMTVYYVDNIDRLHETQAGEEWQKSV